MQNQLPQNNNHNMQNFEIQQKLNPNNQTQNNNNNLDDKLINGPVDERVCTDIFFCLLFIIFTIGFVVISIAGFETGHPERLLVGYDGNGKACGLDTEVKDFKYIYLAVPYPGYFNRSACVSECPTWGVNITKPGVLKCVPNKIVLSCNEQQPFGVDLSQNFSLITTMSADDLNKTTIIYNSTGLWGRLCMPVSANITNITDFSKVLDVSQIQKYFADLKIGWKVILISAFIAIILGIIYAIIVRWCAGVMVWTSIALFMIGIIMLALSLLNNSQMYQNQSQTQTDPSIKKSYQDDALALKAVSYTLFAIMAVSLILIYCFFEKIKLAIAIVKCAGEFVYDVKIIVFVPIIIAILTMMYWAFWVVAFVFLFSLGTITGSTEYPFASITWDDKIKNILYYVLFIGLWHNSFLLSLNQFIIASSTSIWYFSDKQSLFHFPVTKSVYRVFRYHLGTLALGSVLLALVKMVRFILAYMEYQTRQNGASQNQLIKFVLVCISCYVKCFEKFIKFITQNAYIQCAIQGTNFIQSAKCAFELITNNIVKFGITNGIGSYLIFIGKLFITFFTAVICYQILTRAEPFQTQLFSPILPTVFCAFLAFLVGNMILSIYGMSVDTILQCAIIDEEIMKKTNQKPKFQPKPLLEFFQGQIKIDNNKQKKSIF